jgi:GNAT superfamily N-acetyltransferase
VAAEVRSWYVLSYPEMGITSVQRPFGYYRTSSGAPQWGWATITDVDESTVPEMVADLRAFYGERAVSIDVDDETYSAGVRSALAAAGWTHVHSTVFLAYVGSLPTAPPDIAIERVTAEGIDEFSRARLMAFDSTEDEPLPERVAEDSALRLVEMQGLGRCLLTRIDGEVAGICAYYEGTDYLVFLLATRVPFRQRGLARAFLEFVLTDAANAGARSVIINAVEGDRPEALYRSLGFTDVVYRRWAFRQPK